MAAKKAAPQTVDHRKRRVRSHVIADISANHVERLALLKGFSIERMRNDYGLDLSMASYAPNGYVENGTVLIQLKASDKVKYLSGGKSLSFTADVRDLNSWRKDIYPVILIVYDAKRAKAYWMYVQRYFENGQVKIKKKARTHAVRLSTRNVVTKRAIERFAEFKAKVVAQAELAISHA